MPWSNSRVDEELLARRLAGRGRADDRPEVVRERLDTYRAQTRPLIDFYRRQGLLHSVDGEGTPEEVRLRVLSALGCPKS